MSNPYLEKSASLYDFWNNFSGKEYNNLNARKMHLETALSNKETPHSLGVRAKVAGRRMFRARAQAAVGLAGAVGATLGGAKAYENHQNKKTREMLSELMSKQAGLGSLFRPGLASEAASASKSAFSTIKQTAKDSGSAIIGHMNTAHGGKVKDFGESLFKGPGRTQKIKEFTEGSHEVREGLTKAHAPDRLGELSMLRRKQRVAQVGVYGTTAAVGGAYLKGKSKGRNEVLQAQYY